MSRPRSRTARPWQRMLTALLAVLTIGTAATVPVTPAHAADGPVVVNTDTLRDGLFSAYMRSRTNGKEGLRHLFLSAYLYGYRQKNPGVSQATLLKRIVSMDAYYTSNMGADDLDRSVYKYAMKLLELSALHPEAATAAPIIKLLVEETLGQQMSANGAMLDEITAAQFQYAFFSQAHGIQDRIWGLVAQQGRTDADFTHAWDAYFGTRYTVSAAASQDQLMADPIVGTFVNTQALLDHAQNSSEFQAEAREMLQRLLAEINARTAAATESAGEVNLYFPVQGANPDLAEQQRREQEAAERQEWLDGAAAGVHLLATLVSFADPRAAEIVAGTGRAALQIASAVNAFLPALASKGLTAALTSMSGIGLAANVLGAIQALVPLFGGAQPTIEDIILDQLNALREQVSDLTEQMHDRFDRVESALVEIYDTMNAKFDELLELQHATQERLARITRELAELTKKVDFWGQALYFDRQTQERLVVEEVINQYASYRTRTGGRELTFEEYYAQVSKLQFAATNRSVNVPMAAPVGSGDPATVLGLYGFNGSVAYLNDYARRNLGLTAAATQVPAIEYWLMAAEGYKVLLAQNPERAKEVVGVTDQVLASGEAIQDSVRLFSQPRPAGSPERLNPMFTRLVDDYRATGFAIVQRLHAIRDAQQQYRWGYTMFGRPDQTVEKPSAEPAAISSCGAGSVPQRSRPANVVSLDLQPMWVAVAGRPNTPATVCYLAEWVNVTGPEDPDGTRPYTRNADLEVTFRVQQQWDPGQPPVVAREWKKVYPYGRIEQYYPPNRGGQSFVITPIQAMNTGWVSTYKAQFEQSAAYDNSSEPYLRQRVRDWLYQQAGQYYATVVKELTTPGQPLYDLSAQLTERVRLLQAYTKLGFATSVRQDELIGVHLFGFARIPSELGGSQVLAPFVQARDNYCERVDGDGVCVVRKQGDPDPRAGQSPKLVPCTWAEYNDPIERCLNWMVDYRSTQLRQRLETASVRLATVPGYTEGIPEVDDVLQSLRIAEAVART
ncbi:hypothetical protein ACFFX1_05990 [Dactylosporangium sucinum]|nr:hypothetical protein [Dactylosporangium sucinum]